MIVLVNFKRPKHIILKSYKKIYKNYHVFYVISCVEDEITQIDYKTFNRPYIRDKKTKFRYNFAEKAYFRECNEKKIGIYNEYEKYYPK